jgi:tetratricopeptide (TPR) repeat protein/SAM-dependent methyltransferase
VGRTKPDAKLGALFAAAVAQHQAGALAEAERSYRSILTVFPEHAESMHNLGLLALQRGEAATAVELIGKAIKLDDRVGEYHYNLALAWRALDRMDQVAKHLERAIELRPDNGLAHLNLGNARRVQGRAAEAAACYERAIALSPNSAAAHINLANVKSEQAHWDAAIASYRKALALEPNGAETHHRLGAALLAHGKEDEAIAHFETAVALQPDLAGGYEDLAATYLWAGRRDLAAHASAIALEQSETPRAKELFAHSAKLTRFTGDDNGRFRKLVYRALSEGWTRPRELDKVCNSFIKRNPIVDKWIARGTSGRPTRLGGAELLDAAAALAEDELFVNLLQCDQITDIDLECLLTEFRRALLTLVTGRDRSIDEQSLKFLAAVARQCFINEYVYALPADEERRARELRSTLAQAVEDHAPIPASWPIAVAAYFPLHGVPGAEALLDRNWPDCVNALLVQQIKEPQREREISATIPAVTPIGSDVSRAVREQYEENPYPRWIKAGPPVQPIILKDTPRQLISDILIAGCGTGRAAIEFARQMRTARLLAIDLSLASLSYAKRMAEAFYLDNVEFGQADLMMLGTTGRQFDFIETSGVLHHLADPWAGWRVLLSLLRPGGIMQVGLYSALARQNVVAARALIAERGYPPNPAGIRRCREYIMATDDPLLESVMQFGDFFSIGECRDLLFHVQEHRTTLPEIKAFLVANDLNFAGFIPEPSIMRRFAARFPGRSALLDLDCWNSFETEAPGTFGAMYQFWVRKPA